MKKLLIPVVLLAGLLTVFVVGYVWWGENSKSVTSDETKVRFVIPKGWSATQIGNGLYKNNLIRSSLAFKVFVQLTGKTRDLKPGEFTLSSNMNLVGIIDKLMQGPDELWVTVPEGLRREEVVKEFVAELEMNGTRAEEFQGQFLVLSEGKEGFLFPDTYLFPRDADAGMVVRKMLDTFNEKIEGVISEGINNSIYSINQIIVMASIIERESAKDIERPVVSGILWKRLETDGWLLQADATVQYAVANENCKTRLRQGIDETSCEWWPILTKDDLEISSPYNSYKLKSLPPSPIANPGLASIEAAVFPEESQYWFYIHDPEGEVHYAETVVEHNSNVRKYLGK
jgi:UPF0755 protein